MGLLPTRRPSQQPCTPLPCLTPEAIFPRGLYPFAHMGIVKGQGLKSNKYDWPGQAFSGGAAGRGASGQGTRPIASGEQTPVSDVALDWI